MYKTSLLSCTAAAAIILFNIQFTAHAETLEVSEGKQQEVSDKTYETIHAKTGGKITGTNLTVVGNEKTNSNENKTVYSVTAEGANSTIELLEGTTIKGTDSVISLGVEAKDGATFQMTGGTITVSDTGSLFWNNNNKESKLQDVTISSGKDDAPLQFGVIADKNGTVTLNKIKVTQAKNAVIANHDSKITISGGSFEAKNATITALNGSAITLTDNAQITSSDDAGLYAKSNSTITITGGTVTGKNSALITTTGGHIKVTGGTLKTKGTETDAPAEGSKNVIADGFGAFSKNSNSMIELENTTISDVKIGLSAKDSGAINMTGGSIKASVAGALFESSKSDKNKLENVTISSGKDKPLLLYGVKTNKSKVALKNVTVTQADSGIFADNNSTITISGGSFDAKKVTLHAENGSTITLTDNAQITSSGNVGLVGETQSTITMTGGAVTGGEAALVAKTGGHITVTDVALKVKVIDAQAEGAGIKYGFGAFSEGAGSVIELLGNTTITDSIIGLQVQDNGAISMTGGNIEASKAGAVFSNSRSDDNKLENVTISNGKNEAPLINGIDADKGSTVALKNVTVTHAQTAIAADDHSTITVSGGTFSAKNATIGAKNGGTIILKDDAQITSSDNSGLLAQDNGAINMTGGTIKASYNGAAFVNSKSENNRVEGVIISSSKEGALLNIGIEADKASTVALKNVTVTQAQTAIAADDHSTITVSGGTFETNGVTIDATNGSTITLTDNAQITSSDAFGLYAKDNGAINMTGGTIKAFAAGAVFENSKSDKNKLENVIISSGKNDMLLGYGIETEKNSTVALKNVTVSEAISAIAAYDNSKITISGGSFSAKDATISVANGGTIILTDDAKIISSDDNGLYADGLDSSITMTTGSIKGHKTALTAEDGGHITVKDVSITTAMKFSGSGAHAKNPDSIIELHETEISNTSIGLFAENGGVIKMTGGTITTSSGGATFYNSKSDENKLENVTISSNQKDGVVLFTGVNSQASNVTLEKVHITNAKFGAYAMNHSKIMISGGSFAGNDVAVHAQEGSSITLTDNAQITSSGGYGLHANGLDSTITMTTGNITGKEAALAVENGGHIDATNISATAENNGIKFENPEENTTSEINLTNAKLHVKNGVGINVNESTGTVNLGKKSEIRADVLLVTKDSTGENHSTFTLNSDDSILEGRAKIINSPKTIFDLNNNTTWTLTTSKNEKDADGNLLDIAERSRSDVSVLSLDNSSIVFNEPTEDHYHTLHIGSGKPGTSEVYKASGDAKIYFNIAWSDGVASADQKTDRLLIHGDASGNTTVYIKSDSGDKNSVVNAADPSNIGGLSLIQVSGKAEENSFKLANGYTTRNRLPYKYTLTAYGPDSSHGKADVAQNLFDEKNENFWDFRLHKEILETGSGSGSGSGPSVSALVPQTASYLVMPNALFYSGLTDMAKQNALLANIRTSLLGKEEEKQTGFFLYTYGSTGTLSSERGPLKYGYGADIRYAALQGGVTLAAMEGQRATTHFGLVGTYGQLSFTPKDMADASKNTLDKWSLTAYATIQHNNGLYVDTLLSYGMLKGNITNALIGKTAKLNDAKMLSVSTTIGKEFATNVEGLTFEPQAQLAYQHLMFNTIEDADNFTVDMNNPSQWLIRVGGRLTKTVSAENNRPMSFYGKVNLIKTFADDGTIQIGRDFDLDPMGAAIEGGVGINAQLSHNLSLHGDVSYQQKLQKTGISGTSFSGGIRYQF